MNPRELLERARQEKFAIGSFNVDNFEIFKAITNAAIAKSSPVLIELSAGEVSYMGLEPTMALVKEARARGVEMYVNLDHSPKVEDAVAAVKAGFDFIHYDGFQNKNMSQEENIQNLQKLEPIVHGAGKILEGEDQYFQGSSEVHKEALSAELVKQSYTDPVEAKKFVDQTKVDIFAVSVGNLHGLYSSLKHLNTELLTEIRKNLPDTYFSLHGGSGTEESDYKKVIELGVVKININSEMREAYRSQLGASLAMHADEYKSYKYLQEVIVAVQKVVEKKMDIFGSVGKARA